MIKLGEAVEWLFQLSKFSTGAVFAATGTPVGVVFKNGVADALSVTCTIVNGAGETGLWKAVFTPTTAAGFAAADHVSLRVTATVDGVAGGGIVWQDRIDSADLTDVNAKTTNLPTDPADESLIIAATDAVMTRIGSPVAASISADIAAIQAKTVNLPASPAAVGSAMTLANDAVSAAALKTDAVTEIVAAVLAGVVDGTVTVADALLALRAWARGVTVITGSEVAFKKADGTTTAFTLTPSAGGRTVA